MKVLSVKQPFASLIASSEKQIETRSWQTKYRGPIAIHASGRFDADSKEHMYYLQTCFDCLKDVKGYNLPLGCIVATANLYDVKPTSYTCSHFGEWWLDWLTEKEYAIGNFSPNRYGWFLSDVKLLDTPIPCKGKLGLWETDLI